MNKVNEKTATQFAEGTVLTFDASVPSGDYRIPPGKVKKRGTVVGTSLCLSKGLWHRKRFRHRKRLKHIRVNRLPTTPILVMSCAHFIITTQK